MSQPKSGLRLLSKSYEIGTIMNILIISGSPRKGGNTELLVDAFAKGAAAHHHVEIVSALRRMT